jgi:hypothetical protein
VSAVYFDAALDDAARRERLQRGDLFVYAPTASTRALCAFARGLIEAAFAPLDPRTAQFELPLLEFHPAVAGLKRDLPAHPGTTEHLRQIVAAMGCAPDATYFHPPYFRTPTSAGYLNLLGRPPYDLDPHRDTWAAAPPCQITWWIPLYDLVAENTLAIHPDYWQRPVRNGSADFDYRERAGAETAKRVLAAVANGTRRGPYVEEPVDRELAIEVVCQAGGLIMFSSAHLHSTVPNTSGATRYSLDFRTVHLDDLRERRGPPHVDAAYTGTNLLGFRRVSDQAPVPEDLIAMYDVFAPNTVSRGESRG